MKTLNDFSHPQDKEVHSKTRILSEIKFDGYLEIYFGYVLKEHFQ